MGTQPHLTQAPELQPHAMSVSVLVPEGSWRMPTPTLQLYWRCWATPQQLPTMQPHLKSC